MEETKKTNYERWPACKVRIKEIKEAEYVKVSEEYSPDYLIIADKKVSRANILAVVVNIEKEEKFSSVTIDDGTDSIVVRDFDNSHDLSRFERGNVVRIVAKPREFNEQRYMILEIIKKLKDPKWIELRRLELGNHKEEIIETKPKEEIGKETEEIVVEEIQEEKPENKIELIIKTIKEFDKGDGADIEEIISKLNSIKAESIISSLIKEGEVFEIRPGRVKVL
ncbi:hypothetical protein HN695_07325 [Candidatus Woesearchaeota archaeon]|nr:hypothetical protein [Candidatus Woesearchaeota archaeon]MBT6336745.1 hypothetical protein [Candidatus Woesearchaeota archaeon]MBT7928118.1 hypothetical protein [Candidatus Woesearchaeota archaeon]